MSDDQHRRLPEAPPSPTFQQPPAPPQMPVLPEHVQGQQAPNPLLTQTFLAWLQYMHLQNQLHQTQARQQAQSQQTHQQQQQQQIQFPFTGLPHVQGYPPTLQIEASPPQAGPSQPRQRRLSTAQETVDSPVSETGEGEMDQVAVAEDKRRRNTAASGESFRYIIIIA